MAHWVRAITLAGMTVLAGCLGDTATEFPHQEEICTTNTNREAKRLDSAHNFPQPVVTRMLVNGSLVWMPGQTTAPTINPGDEIELQGSGFGRGTRIDFSKIMIGNTRVLETNLRMFKQTLDAVKQVHFELPETHSKWPKDVISWRDDTVRFRVPLHVSSGPLRLQVQKRIGANESLTRPGQPHNVIDGQTYRIQDKSFNHKCDVVSKLSPQTKSITPIPVQVNNPDFDDMVDLGRALFWAYDYNIGISHNVRNLDWSGIFGYRAFDPYTRKVADPRKLFGAYRTVRGQVPDEAIDDVYFADYPQKTPVPGLLSVGPQRTEGTTSNSGWVGYRYAQSNHPFKGYGSWIGFNCASCHSYQITYEEAPGQTRTRVFGGLPAPEWSLKWAVIGPNILERSTSTFDGVVADEPGPAWDPGTKGIDKTGLVYGMPAGAGEHNLMRLNGEGSLTDNDYNFSPVVFPNVTNHLPIRRSLSHTESYVGFEGSYIHAEEPDGATGSMTREGLQALTAYMTTLDKDDELLINIGLYRWLKANGKLGAQTGNAGMGEGEFVQAGWKAFPGIQQAVAQGKSAFDRDCGSCHNDDLGANTNERMVRLDEVGRFFTPTIYQREQQSVRATFLRNMYWVSSRGLLSDGHVRNLEDLVDPARCTEGSPLYNQYYTLHEPARPDPGTPDQPKAFPDLNRKGDVFRVRKEENYFPYYETTAVKRNRFIERHKYFVTVPWDDDHYYWDYQKMRAEYGTHEMGAPEPIGMPATPHPWCAANNNETQALVQYVLTL
jgi:hypothetical protein